MWCGGVGCDMVGWGAIAEQQVAGLAMMCTHCEPMMCILTDIETHLSITVRVRAGARATGLGSWE